MIDWHRANDLKEAIGARAFGEVVTLFLEEADGTVTQLIAATTAAAMQHGLHVLKGSALNLGFNELAQLCQICETRAESGDKDLPLNEVQAVYTASRAEFLANLEKMTA